MSTGSCSDILSQAILVGILVGRWGVMLNVLAAMSLVRSKVSSKQQGADFLLYYPEAYSSENPRTRLTHWRIATRRGHLSIRSQGLLENRPLEDGAASPCMKHAPRMGLNKQSIHDRHANNNTHQLTHNQLQASNYTRHELRNTQHTRNNTQYY